jgi:hypothetical protein
LPAESNFTFTARLGSFVDFEIRQNNLDVVVTWDKMENELKIEHATATVKVIFTVKHKPDGGL